MINLMRFMGLAIILVLESAQRFMTHSNVSDYYIGAILLLT